MFWKILQWVQFVISLIREAEDELGRGRGAEKRALVTARAGGLLGELSTAMQIGSCSAEVLVSHVGQFVDGAVGLMNCLGLLGYAAVPRASSAAAAPAETPAPDPGPGG